MNNKATKTTKKSKNKKIVNHGIAHIFASFNNTIIMISDLGGNALSICSAGSCGFKGGKKGTAYAAQIAANQILNQVTKNFNIKKLDIYVKGIGQGRDSAIRTILNKDIQVEIIEDKTTIPHGGVRPRKARRI